jgi:ABC-type amino acid transport system permease subunit
MDLGFVTDRLINETAQPVAIFLGAVVCYLILALSAGWFFSVLEHRVAIKR